MRAVVAVCLGLLVLATWPVGVAADDPSVTSTTHFTYEVPLAYTGHHFLRFTLVFAAPAACDLGYGLAGRDGPNPVHEYTTSDFGGSAFWSGYLAQAHAPGLDTRTVQSIFGGLWASETHFLGDFSGTQTWTVAGFDLVSWTFPGEPAFRPFFVDIFCTEPFEVSGLANGSQGRSFSAESMEGGVGASANFFASAALTLGDGLAASITSSDVLFRAQAFNFGGVSVGELRLAHPEGSETYSLTAVGGAFGTFAFDGGPGDYALGLDRVGAGDFSGLIGILIGLDPV